MRKLALAAALSVAACGELPEPTTPQATGLPIPAELMQELGEVVDFSQGSELKIFIPAYDGQGYARVTGVDCSKIAGLLQNPEIEISPELQGFLETLIQDGNAEFGDDLRVIAACSGESFDPSVMGS